MAKGIITVQDSEDGATVSFGIEFDPPLEDSESGVASPAQTIAFEWLQEKVNALNQQVRATNYDEAVAAGEAIRAGDGD